jgi:ssDNA-binding Zn-finger/Zn-ribbon topoisomerase 1
MGLVNIDDDLVGICPDCRAGLVRRTNRKTGNEFIGCSTWPECDYTYPPSRARFEDVGERPFDDPFDDPMGWGNDDIF